MYDCDVEPQRRTLAIKRGRKSNGVAKEPLPHRAKGVRVREKTCRYMYFACLCRNMESIQKCGPS